MDDFSWGTTRIVTGERGRQIVVSDEGKFDPKTIPRKRWEEYQAELWDAQTQREDDDARSQISAISYATKSAWGANKSEYEPHASAGARSETGFPPSRPLSTVRYDPPPRYPSNTSIPQVNQAAGSTYGGYEMSDLQQAGINLPTDDYLLDEIRDILANADLMTVTKKSVKQEMERRFGVPLDAKRQYIGSATEAILGGQL